MSGVGEWSGGRDEAGRQTRACVYVVCMHACMHWPPTHTHAPLCLRALSVVANTTAALASCALVIQALVPFSTYSSPARCGVRCGAVGCKMGSGQGKKRGGGALCRSPPVVARARRLPTHPPLRTAVVLAAPASLPVRRWRAGGQSVGRRYICVWYDNLTGGGRNDDVRRTVPGLGEAEAAQLLPRGVGREPEGDGGKERGGQGVGGAG